MALGLIQFLLGTRHLAPESSVVPKPLSAEERNTAIRKALLGAVVAAAFLHRRRARGAFTINWALSPLDASRA